MPLLDQVGTPTAYVRFVRPPPGDTIGTWVGLEAPEDECTISLLVEVGVSRAAWNLAPGSARRTALAGIDVRERLGEALRDTINTPPVSARAGDYVSALVNAEPSVSTRNGYRQYLDQSTKLEFARLVLAEVSAIIDRAASSPARSETASATARRAWAESTVTEVNRCLKGHFAFGPGRECRPADIKALAAGERPSRVSTQIVGRALGVSARSLRRRGRL